MLKEKVIAELNTQMTREFNASYAYLAMSIYCSGQNMEGFATWLKMQSEEEYSHALKFYKYIDDLGAKVELGQIDKPKQDFKSFEDLFAEVLKQEVDNTKHIENLASLAQEERDQLTYNFLGWFLEEQVEEVALASSVLEKVKLIGSNDNGLYMLAQELGQREPEPTGE